MDLPDIPRLNPFPALVIVEETGNPKNTLQLFETNRKNIKLGRYNGALQKAYTI